MLHGGAPCCEFNMQAASCNLPSSHDHACAQLGQDQSGHLLSALCASEYIAWVFVPGGLTLSITFQQPA